MHSKSIEEVFIFYQTSNKGLTEEEAKKRNKDYGLNAIDNKKRFQIIKVFLGEFNDLLVAILISSAILSLIFHDSISAIVIFIVILLNALLGTYEYMKASKSLNRLKKKQSMVAKVLRDNELKTIDSEYLTLGDIVFFSQGDLIPADLRIFDEKDLFIDESSLNGEAIPTEKENIILNEEVSSLDMVNIAYQDSIVTSGSGFGVVINIGKKTEIGKIKSQLIKSKKEKTPLELSLDRLSKVLAIIIFLVSLAVFFIEVKRGETTINSLMFAVALAVAAIPEALGSIVTITLALGSEKMASHNAIVKDLKAIEALGNINQICTDKTGTITQNKMKVKEFFCNNQTIYNLGNDMTSERILRALYYCNTVKIIDNVQTGDPTELALYEYAVNNSQLKKITPDEVIPFDSTRKMMSVRILDNVYTKGAIDKLLPLIKNISINNEVHPFKNLHHYKIISVNERLSRNGIRVMALCYKKSNKIIEENLTLLGLVALIDPIRTNINTSIKMALEANVSVSMITGDYLETAKRIAIDSGFFFDGDLAINGSELVSLDNDSLKERISRIKVFSRVTPTQKFDIVKAYQDIGKKVLMTGDGINDALALRQSNVGIAMGDGNAITHDASQIILVDNNFQTIVESVLNGRIIFLNIRNAIMFLLSGNIASILVVIATVTLGLPLPLIASQLLFINLVTDSLPAIAIGMDNNIKNIRKSKPINGSKLIDYRFLVIMLIEGLIIASSVFAGYIYGYQTSIIHAKSYAFIILCLGRLFHGFNCINGSIVKTRLRNRYLIEATLIGITLLSVILFVPYLNTFFGVAISKNDLGTIILLSIMPLLFIQIFKMIKEVKS